MFLRNLIPSLWQPALTAELQPKITKLEQFLEQAPKPIYPPQAQWFSALQVAPKDVRVVIIGQDPYHHPNQAHGLCFSVLPPTSPPPSLVNIFKELERTVSGFKRPAHGNLTAWVNQGVLLLNTTLTVQAYTPLSHQRQGWEEITDAFISWIQMQVPQIIFVLWGNHAKSKIPLINTQHHVILQSGHPSPLSIRHFANNNHFVLINQLLEARGDTPIDWKL